MIYEQLEARITAWAANQPDIRAVIAVGSQARGDADTWSDLDLMVFTTERERYLDPDWLHNFGNAWLTYKDEAGPGDPEWFAIYDEGLKVDIVLLQVVDESSHLEELMRHYPYQNVFARGVKVLYDRQGQARSLSPRPIPVSALPSAAAFEHVVNGLLLESVTTAKFIARGDYWRAQHWFSYDLRPRVLKLIEWHAHGRDTWYNGRFIDAWADAREQAALPQTFALAERESLQTALYALLDLGRLTGQETASRFGFTYPIETHEKITGLIDTILDPA